MLPRWSPSEQTLDFGIVCRNALTLILHFTVQYRHKLAQENTRINTNILQFPPVLVIEWVIGALTVTLSSLSAPCNCPNMSVNGPLLSVLPWWRDLISSSPPKDPTSVHSWSLTAGKQHGGQEHNVWRHSRENRWHIAFNSISIPPFCI